MILTKTEGSRSHLSEPFYSKVISENEQILCIEFSQFEWSQDVILIGFKSKIVLAHLEIDPFDVKIITEFAHPVRCTTLSISPDTSLALSPREVLFCAGGADFKLRIFKSDLGETNLCKVLSGHNSYINDCSFDTENQYLASTGDDNTLRIWYKETFELKCTMPLMSPGMNVYWHRADSGKLLVAEKMGIIRLCNVEKEICFQSINFCKPLSSFHWSPSDIFIVASLLFGELQIWDLTNVCLPLQVSTLFSKNGGQIKFSPLGELVAGINNLDQMLKVFHVKSESIKLSASVTLPSNICWHYRYPLVCIGDDSKLCFWKVTAN
ncbi:unnamed protein product [Phyllotreta striolata]|uniref:Nucleoporin Nup37 n=1 Tax=Phyllotreta striolata TaxID=444603 RepID=A0A9N9TIQ6_PHYSR|nr:unnamed protein product [Phyllotreta striolata]